MATINYILKPFAGAQSDTAPRTHQSNARPHEQLTRADEISARAPAVVSRGDEGVAATLTPQPMPAMKRLALDKGAEWCRILRAARQPDASGHSLLNRFSLAEVAAMVGTSAPTLHRLVAKFGKLADNELTPERLAPIKDGGRGCEWEPLLKDNAFRAKLLELYNATIGAANARTANDRRTAKIATALRNFAYEPECPAKLADRLREGYQPVPFVNYLRSAVTPEVEARIRGPKHAQLYGHSSVRDWTCRLPNGDRFEIPAAYTLSMDDMSVNHPFYVERAGGEVILSRQGLYSIWSKHKVWQSVELVARARESYTAADILRTFYKLCLAMGGVPHMVEFEQGIWKSNKIRGFQRDGDWLLEQELERPGMAEAEKNLISDGLGLCGVQVLYKHKAHHKHIESNFNPLQDILAIVARQYQCIGRYAGEFELPGKQLRRVRAGSHHPRDLHFASQAEMADCIQEAFRRTWEMDSAVRGPDGRKLSRYEAHQADLQKVGLLPLTDRLFAACLPGELRKTTIRGGYINVERRGGLDSYQFRHEDFARLGDGYELYYKFDETDPNLGAVIYNRTSPTNSANYQGWKMDEFMFTAPREIPGPKLEVSTAPAGVEIKTVEQLYGAGAIDRGDTERRKQDKFVATQFRAMPRPGQPSVRSASARDGRGNVVSVTNQREDGGSQVEDGKAPARDAAAETAQTIRNNPAGELPERIPNRTAKTKDTFAEMFGG